MNQRFANVTRMKRPYPMSFPNINRTGSNYTDVKIGKDRTIGYEHGATHTGDGNLIDRVFLNTNVPNEKVKSL